MNSLTFLAIVVLIGLATTGYSTPDDSNVMSESESLEQFLNELNVMSESESLEQFLNQLMANKQLQEMHSGSTMTDKETTNEMAAAVAQSNLRLLILRQKCAQLAKIFPEKIFTICFQRSSYKTANEIA